MQKKKKERYIFQKMIKQKQKNTMISARQNNKKTHFTVLENYHKKK